MNRALLVLSMIGLGACASVLGFRSSDEHPFEHRAHTTKGIGCKRCHAGIEGEGDDTPVVLPDTALCLECHAQPHDQRRCRTCHGQSDTDRRTEQARHYLRFDHRLHTKERELEGKCVRCHNAVRTDGPDVLPRMADCLGCHEHSDEFELRACGRCHENLETEETRPQSHVVHGPDFTRTHGAKASAQADLCATCHRESDCASCHGAKVPALAHRLELADPRLDGIHRANFVARHALEAKADPGLCTTCHATDTCQRCHEERGVASGAATGSPHPSGWVGLRNNLHGVAARRDPVSCASCHGGAGEMLCVSCHKVGGIGGNPHPAGWSSNKGKSTELPCRLCHAGL